MIFAFPNSILRIIAFMTGKLYHEAFCREIRCDVDVKKHTVFLIRVLFNLHNLEAFDEFVRSHYTIEEFHNLTTYICFRASSPIFKCPTVQEVNQYLRYIVEYTNYGVGLQAKIISINNVLAEKAITLLYSFTIGTSPIRSSSEISLLRRSKRTLSTSLSPPNFFPATT